MLNSRLSGDSVSPATLAAPANRTGVVRKPSPLSIQRNGLKNLYNYLIIKKITLPYLHSPWAPHSVSRHQQRLFAHPPSTSSRKINRHTEKIEPPVGYRKQRTGPPINRHISRGPRFTFSIFASPISLRSFTRLVGPISDSPLVTSHCLSNRNSAGIRIPRNLQKTHDKAISNRNTNQLSGHLQDCLPTPYTLNPTPQTLNPAPSPEIRNLPNLTPRRIIFHLYSCQ
jgi:hypothetical protein